MRPPRDAPLRWTALLTAVVLGLSSFAPGPPAAAQPSQARLDAALDRVEELTARIESGEARVQSLKNRLNTLSAQVGRESVKLGGIRADLQTTERRLEATKEELQALRDRIRERARTVYMHGATQMIDLVLGARSFSEFTGRVSYASAVAKQDTVLVQRVRTTQAKLDEQRTEQERLERAQDAQVDALSSRQRVVRSTFAAQLAAVSQLASQRIEATKLVAELEDELGGKLGGLKRVAGHGMTISYGAWAALFLGALGAPASRNNLIAVVAWEASEGTQATWNPLATTKDMPGATIYNSHGVKNYRSKEQGIEATILTLKLPNRGYEPVIANLRASAEPMETAKAINASLWCRGCAGGSYVVGIIPAVEEYYGKFAG